MKQDLYTVRDYGKITINLKNIMTQKNISRNALARAINTRFEVIDKWYQGHVEKMDTDILARICYVLDCKPSDIIIYQTENDFQTTASEINPDIVYSYNNEHKNF